MSSSERLERQSRSSARHRKSIQKFFRKRLQNQERTIQKHESGEIIIKMDVLKQIANQLNVPFQELLFPAKITNTAKDNKTAEYHMNSTVSDVISVLLP